MLILIIDRVISDIIDHFGLFCDILDDILAATYKMNGG
jgi:hypothetical protein